MKKKLNLLLTCASASGPIYQAKTLEARYGIFLVDGSSYGLASHLHWPYARVPFGNEPGYSQAIEKLVKKWKIDCIVPGADEELLPIRKLSSELGILSVIPQSEAFIALCLNKKELMKALHRENISSLLPYKRKRGVKFPAVAKPISGRGSREVHVIKTHKELDGYLNLYGKKFEDVLVQPYIDGEEYTVSVIVNNLNKIIGIVPKRVIEKRGITRAAVSENNSQIMYMCEAIVKAFEPRGPFNVQLKLKKGKAYIFEINPRLSTTLVLTDKAFGNETDLFIKYFDKSEIKKPPMLKAGVSLYRYEENVFK